MQLGLKVTIQKRLRQFQLKAGNAGGQVGFPLFLSFPSAAAHRLMAYSVQIRVIVIFHRLAPPVFEYVLFLISTGF